MSKPLFAVLLCRMKNGTVSKLRTHRIDSDESYIPIRLSNRQLQVILTAERVTAPDVHGNASQQMKRR